MEESEKHIQVIINLVFSVVIADLEDVAAAADALDGHGQLEWHVRHDIAKTQPPGPAGISDLEIIGHDSQELEAVQALDRIVPLEACGAGGAVRLQMPICRSYSLRVKNYFLLPNS